MNTNYCSKCNEPLEQNTKFCTNCGAQVKKIEKTKKIKSDVPLVKKENPKSSSKILKILFSLLVIVVLGIIVKSYIFDIDVSRNSFSISKMLTQIEGEWQEPTGTLLKNKEAIIKFRKKGDIVVGEDSEKKIYIQLIPTSSKNFSGLVVIDGRDDDFLVDYYKEENKLVFFSTLTKTSWYIIRINH